MKEKLIIKTNHLLFFLGILIFYLALSILGFDKELSGDEPRYLMFAKNLLHGYYSPPIPNVNLRNGPGYPMYLAPFFWLELPVIVPILSNAVLMCLASVFFYKTLKIYIKKSEAYIYTVIFNFLLLPSYSIYSKLLTEPLSIFLITFFCYLFCKALIYNQTKQILKTSIVLAYLALTKVLFGYVVAFMIFAVALILIVSKSQKQKIALKVVSLALIFCLPYLLYTFNLTGNFFYWSNNGGYALYCMSTPHEGEFGDFSIMYMDDEGAYANHGELFNRISKLSPLEKDSTLRQEALINIKKYPLSFVKNWMANVQRMIFSTPYSYNSGYFNKKIEFYSFTHSILYVLGLLLIWPTIRNRERIPTEILILLLIALTYFFGQSLVSALPRYFYIAIAPVLLWISFVISEVLKIRTTENMTKNSESK